jgi:hypothetical protein
LIAESGQAVEEIVQYAVAQRTQFLPRLRGGRIQRGLLGVGFFADS